MDTRHKKKWTEEEIDLLCEYWGTYSTPTIAKRLCRSVCAVLEKAGDLGLGAQVNNSDMISMGTLLRELGMEKSYGWNADKMIAMGLKYHTQKVIKRSYRMVYIDEFWDFAEKHQNLFNFSNLEENVFGEEPAWVKTKRAKDYKLSREKVKSKTHWTETENRELRDLLKMHMYTADELAKRFRRSKGSIRQHAAALFIEDRPIIQENENAWSDKQIEVLKTLVKEGKPIKEISGALGRTNKSVRNKLYKMYSTENVYKIRLLLGSPQITTNTACYTTEPESI